MKFISMDLIGEFHLAGIVTLLTVRCSLLSVLVHIFGPQSHVVRCVAVLWVAVDPV